MDAGQQRNALFLCTVLPLPFPIFPYHDRWQNARRIAEITFDIHSVRNAPGFFRMRKS